MLRSILVVLTSFLIAACSSDNGPEARMLSAGAADGRFVEQPMTKVMTDASSMPEVSAPSVDEVPMRRLLREGDLVLRTDQLERARGALLARARALGAESTDQSASTGWRDQVDVVLRVPSPRFDRLADTLSSIPGVRVESSSLRTIDATAEWVDLDARLATRRAALERLRELLARSGSLEDLLAVERRAMEVQEQIESAEARLRVLAGQESRSTLRVTLWSPSATVPNPEPGFVRRLAASFVEGLDLLQDIVLLATRLWPLLGGAVLVAGILLVLLMRRRRRG